MSRRTVGRPRQTSHASIRDAARALFAAEGYDAVPLTRIAAAAGISRTALFSYYPAKADLMTEELEAHVDSVRAFLAEHPSGDALDIVVAAMLVAASYSVDEHADFAQRRAICRASDELTARVARSAAELTGLIADHAVALVPPAKQTLMRDLTHALAAVASKAIEDWSQHPPEQDLDVYLAARLRPLRDAAVGLLRD